MPLNENFFFSSDLNTLTVELDDMYRKVSQEVNGVFRRVENPRIIGLGTAGVGSYIDNEALYFRNGIFVDYWFYFYWNAHTGAGGLGIELPFLTYNQTIVPAVGFCVTSDLVYPAGITAVNIVVDANSRVANLIGYGSGISTQLINIQSSGAIEGYIRYVSRDDY